MGSTKERPPGPNKPGQVDGLPTVQPLVFSRHRPPEEELQGSTQHRPPLLPLPSSFPTVWTQQILEASRSAVLGPFCSYWEAAQWAAARMDWHPGDSSGRPWPTLTHSTTHSGAAPLRAAAAAGGGTGTSGCRHRAEVRRDPRLAAFAPSAPPTRAPRQKEPASPTGRVHLLEALSSSEKGSLVFPALWGTPQSCSPMGGERGKEERRRPLLDPPSRVAELLEVSRVETGQERQEH